MTVFDLDLDTDTETTSPPLAAPTVAVRMPARATTAYPPASRGDDDLARITALWDDPVLREAVTLASPDLAAGADAVVGGRPTTSKRLVALRRSLLKYAIRVSTRPTPFGLFSGVATASFGTTPLGLCESSHRKSVRLGQPVVQELRRRAESRPQALRVALNPVAVRRDDRLHLPFHGAAEDGAHHRVDVRVGPALGHVLDVLHEPTLVSELAACLRARFDGAEPAMIDGFLAELVVTGILVTNLAPSAFDADPATRLLAQGDAVVRDVLPIRDEYGATALGEGRGSLMRLFDHLDAVAVRGLQRGLQVDLFVDCDGALPARLRRQATDTVDALCRLTVIAAASPALARHADRFVERFGDVEVSLLDAVDPVTGIGMPSGYPGSPHPPLTPSPVESAELSALFAELVDDARRGGRTAVELDPSRVASLPVRGVAPPSVDVFLELGGTDPADPTVALGAVGAAMPAGRSSGRFAGSAPRLAEHMRVCARLDERRHPEALVLEMDYLTSNSGANNVALSPSVYAHRLALTSQARPGATTRTVHDLRLGVEGGRFYLRDRVTGRRVLTRRPNLVTTEIAADLVRFLEDVTDDGTVRPSWSWGSLEGRLDFYPEVSLRRVVLSPAKWRVPTSATNDEAVRLWAARVGLPRYVHAGSDDNRLLLDLHDPEHLDLLVREVAPGLSYVSAAAAPGDLGHVRDSAGRRYATEIVVSVFRVPQGEPSIQPGPRPVREGSADRSLPPGDRWWYADVYCEPPAHAAVVAALHDDPSIRPKTWYHVRYHDGRHHLRVRLRADGVDPAAVATTLTRLRDRRLVSTFSFRPYERELERYGGAETLTACEELFCAETAFIAAHPEWAAPAGLLTDRAPATTDDLAAGLALVEAWLHALGGDDDETHSMLGLAVAGYHHEFAARSPELRKQVRRLLPADLAGRGADPARDLSRAMGTVTRLTSRVDDPLRRHGIHLSLLHMWCNRLGFPREREYQLVFAARQRLQGRIRRADVPRGEER